MVQTILETKAVGSLSDEVERDLDVIDPSPDVAMAILNGDNDNENTRKDESEGES